MVKNPARAEDFLNNLSFKSIDKQKKEIEEIKASFPELIDEKEKKLEPWDMLYAQEKLMQTKYSVDEDLVKQYFPLNKTVDGLIKIYERFFGLTITSKPTEGLWDPEVRVLEIKEKNSSKVYGYILLDLFPRANKYSHACHATIIGGLERGRDVSTTSLSLVIANFSKPTPSKPSLMNLSDARTFFHEFGHAIHAILGRTEFFGTSGTNVKVDFVELPSQMLEEWLWDKEILKMISCHYKSSEKMPDELISKILQSRQAFSGTFIGRQVLLSKFSLECFGVGTQKNLDELFRQIHSSLHLSYSYDPASHFAASFGHLDEYGARYYGYLWSRVFALDVFEQIKKEGLLNEKVGKRYISTILGKGGSDDPENLLRSFLGRDPSDQPFLKNYGM
jgi:thimet oligopeptidase